MAPERLEEASTNEFQRFWQRGRRDGRIYRLFGPWLGFDYHIHVFFSLLLFSLVFFTQCIMISAELWRIRLACFAWRIWSSDETIYYIIPLHFQNIQSLPILGSFNLHISASNRCKRLQISMRVTSSHLYPQVHTSIHLSKSEFLKFKTKQ